MVAQPLQGSLGLCPPLLLMIYHFAVEDFYGRNLVAATKANWKASRGSNADLEVVRRWEKLAAIAITGSLDPCPRGWT